MKIVFVESSSRAWGSEQHFINLAKGCHAAGANVVAVVRANTTVAKLLREAGVDVRETPFRGGADPCAMLTVVQAIRETHTDWVVTDHQKHYWVLWLIARLTGTRLAVFRHMAYVRGWLTRVVFPRLVDRFFVVSKFALNALVQAGAPRHRLYCSYNPIDLDRFKPNATSRNAIRQQLGLLDTDFLVGFVGRQEEGKGVALLRYAFDVLMAKHSNIRGLWVGGGPELHATQQWAAQSDSMASHASGHDFGHLSGPVLGHASRHTFIDWTDVPEDYFSALDCLVVPSSAVETFGRVAAEAQASGVPLIATQVGGLSEAFVAGQTGIALDSFDPALIAAQIESVMLEADGVRSRVAQGRRFVRRFEVKQIAEAFMTELSRNTEVASPSPARTSAKRSDWVRPRV